MNALWLILSDYIFTLDCHGGLAGWSVFVYWDAGSIGGEK